MSACVEAGTHHVDISGEPQYLEKMQLKYHKEAQEKGVRTRRYFFLYIFVPSITVVPVIFDD